MALRPTLKETYEYRRERLRQLLQDEYGDNQSELARRAGVSHTTINYFLSARAPINERRARLMEQALDLKLGWFDQKPIWVQTRSPLSPPDRRQSQATKPKRQRVAARASGMVPRDPPGDRGRKPTA